MELYPNKRRTERRHPVLCRHVRCRKTIPLIIASATVCKIACFALPSFAAYSPSYSLFVSDPLSRHTSDWRAQTNLNIEGCTRSQETASGIELASSTPPCCTLQLDPICYILAPGLPQPQPQKNVLKSVTRGHT